MFLRHLFLKMIWEGGFLFTFLHKMLEKQCTVSEKFPEISDFCYVQVQYQSTNKTLSNDGQIKLTISVYRQCRGGGVKVTWEVPEKHFFGLNILTIIWSFANFDSSLIPSKPEHFCSITV